MRDVQPALPTVHDGGDMWRGRRASVAREEFDVLLELADHRSGERRSGGRDGLVEICAVRRRVGARAKGALERDLGPFSCGELDVGGVKSSVIATSSAMSTGSVVIVPMKLCHNAARAAGSGGPIGNT